MARGREADAVVARFGGAEGELAGVRAFGVHDTMIVVEDLVDGYGYGEVRVGSVCVCLGGVLDSGVVA